MESNRWDDEDDEGDDDDDDDDDDDGDADGGNDGGNDGSWIYNLMSLWLDLLVMIMVDGWLGYSSESHVHR